jgi:hypothetical protein
VTLNGTGVVTYTPSVDYAGRDVFMYTVRDDDSAVSNEAAVTVTVNPSPVISSLAPVSVTAGAPAFTLTVKGRHFVSSSSVQWAGEPRATTFVSSTRLLAQITAADVASEGTVGVAVANPALDGGPSNVLPFEIARPGGKIYLPFVGKGY